MWKSSIMIMQKCVWYPLRVRKEEAGAHRCCIVAPHESQHYQHSHLAFGPPSVFWQVSAADNVGVRVLSALRLRRRKRVYITRSVVLTCTRVTEVAPWASRPAPGLLSRVCRSAAC